MKTNKTTALLAASAMAAALGMSSGTVFAGAHETAEEPATEKCYGVAQGGQTDSDAYDTSCAGQATVDGDANEWVTLPAGTCEKIVGGSTEPQES